MRFVDIVEIVRTAVTGEHFGAGDGIEECVIAGNAAAILGRASPFAAAEVGIELSGLAQLDPLDDDAVPPVVAHVVGVFEGGDAALDEAGELGGTGAVDLVPP